MRRNAIRSKDYYTHNMQALKLENGDRIEGDAETEEFDDVVYTAIKGNNSAGIFTDSKHRSDGCDVSYMTSNRPMK